MRGQSDLGIRLRGFAIHDDETGLAACKRDVKQCCRPGIFRDDDLPHDVALVGRDKRQMLRPNADMHRAVGLRTEATSTWVSRL